LVKPTIARELKARINVLLEKKEQLDKLRSQYELSLNTAIVDSITGLYSHDYFKKFLGPEIKRSLRHTYPVSLFMIDLDEFKVNNDTLGHAAGDDILRALGETIQSAVREIDLVACYGGMNL
jgi:two-component system cell cycle response regulator